MVEIIVPTLGESVTEATVAQWLKQEGEAVKADEPIVELETDKVTLEVNAPADGVISKITVSEGENVEVGAVLGELSEGAAAQAPAQDSAEDAEQTEASAPTEDKAPAADEPAAAPSEEPKLSPAVRKMIADNDLDPAHIPASGEDGRITKEDVQNYMGGSAPAPAPAPEEKPAPAPAPQASAPKPAPAPAPAKTAAAPARDAGAREEKVKMTKLRQVIAARLKDAQNTAAILTTFNEVDMKPVMDVRKIYKDAFEKKHGIKLGFMSFFVKAAIQALKEFPAVNAEISGDSIIYKNYYNIGVAVSTPQGLVVPVLRDADQMSMAEIESTIVDLGKRARDGKLGMDEMQGGTFTITNGGVFGSLLSTPILNAPQSGILGMHSIQQRPVVLPSGDIVARPMMYLAHSYDHRIIDGREAVSFLVRLKQLIEDPQRLVLDV